MSRPNILLVVFDTARADAFEPYGAARGSSPVVSDIAGTGWAAPRAYAPCNWTLPSHAAMFTGLLPGPLGLTSSVAARASEMVSRSILEERKDRVLAEGLRRNGYATAAISANPWISEVNGFATGFERFLSIQGPPRKPLGTGLRSRAAWALDVLAARADDGAAEAERLLRDWLADASGKPFFWFVNLMECHSPYLPPKPFNDLGSVGRLRASREASRHLTIEAMYRYSLREKEIPASALARMRRLYAASIRLMDAWLGRVLEALDRGGVLDETIVVVTADHGENLGENHLISHIVSLDDRLIRVPFVARGPLAAPNAPMLSLAQLPSLLARAIDLPEHPWHDDVTPDGVAVAQASTEMLLPVLEQLIQGWDVSEETVRAFARSMTCATDGSLKLVRDETGDRAFLMESDALEKTPLAPDAVEDRESLARLQAAIERVEAQRSDPAVSGPTQPRPSDEVAALEERMRQLGYL